MKTIIIEDEPLVAKDLRKMITQLAPDLEVVDILGSLASAKTWFDTHPEPDLLFLDIQLSDGVSFDLFTYVKVECPVIFTTAYDEYAIRAFKLNSIDYLLKPIDPVELKAAIEKFRRVRSSNPGDIGQQINELLKHMGKTTEKSAYKERFTAHFKNTLVPVMVNEVGYFIKNELIYLVTNDARRLVTDYATMEEVEHLVNPSTFFRANRQHIVHINAVGHVKSSYNGKLALTLKAPLNIEIEISREKATEFKKWLE